MNEPAWRTHPLVFWTLLVAAFLPAILLVTAAGIVLDAVWPDPGVLAVLVGLPALVAMLLVGMLLGAFAWLLVARHRVERAVIAAFFLDPNVPLFSAACARIFDAAYPRERPREPRSRR